MRWRDLLLMTLLVDLLFIAYLPAMQGEFIWDDSAHVTRPDLRSFHGLWRIWIEPGATQQYYPVLHSAFWLEHRLWGDRPVAYHVTNVFFHAVAVCLVVLALRRLGIPGAPLAAAIFALHPVNVESVAWISEQKNTLSAVFYLSSLLAYLRFDEKRDRLSYTLASAFFVLGLLTKTVTASLPAALLVILWWQRGRLSWKRDVTPLAPWLVASAIGGMLTVWVERNLIGAQGIPFELTILQRVLLAGRVIWFYLAKLIWPANLVFVYPRWSVDPFAWQQYLFSIGAMVLLLAAWLVRHRWRGPMAALLFFIGSLFPGLGFVNVYPFIFSFVADHFQYLPSLGIIVFFSAISTQFLSRMPKPFNRAGIALCVVLLLLLGFSTRLRSQAYRNPLTLYQTTLEKNPDCWLCRNNLGALLADAGNPGAAIEQYQEALRVKPDYALALNNLGNALSEMGQLSSAVGYYEQALRLSPESDLVHMNLGSTLLTAGRLSDAVEHYKQAIQISPRFVEAHYGLGTALLQMGELSEAEEQFESVLQIDPGHERARLRLEELQSRQSERQ